MTYKFADRMKEWTSYAGIAAAGLAAMIPQLVPADNHWVQIWQAAQLFVAGAMIFIPQTAGTTAVENDSWTLLRAFAKNLPPQYAGPMQPLLSTLAAHLANAETGVQPMPIVLPPQSLRVDTPPSAPPKPESAMPIADFLRRPAAPAQPVEPPQRVYATPVPPPAAEPAKPAVAPASPVSTAPLVADPAAALNRVS